MCDSDWVDTSGGHAGRQAVIFTVLKPNVPRTSGKLACSLGHLTSLMAILSGFALALAGLLYLFASEGGTLA